MNNNIPFLDLISPHQALEEEFIQVCRETIQTGRFIGGPMVEGFEREFAEFCGAKYCSALSSGTDALRLALIASDIKAGEAVITVPNTFIATTEAITQAGALPEFVDIDERTFNLNADLLANYLEKWCDKDVKTGRPISKRSGKTISGIIPVHLYGQAAAMDEILEIAENFHLIVIEDACQAHGAEYFSRQNENWKNAGSMGHAAAFSFYPGKNLGALGEGGAVTTNHSQIDKKIRILRDHGQARKYIHELEGYNGRLDAMQCGFLRVKLKHLRQWNHQRKQAADCYDQLLKPFQDVITPYVPEWTRSVYHLYIIRTQNRQAMQKKLTEGNIGTGLHYPMPLHLQEAYKYLGYKSGDFPITEKVAAEILSLPMYPGLSEGDIDTIVETMS